jgi:Tfp pilus assembly protein PilX
MRRLLSRLLRRQDGIALPVVIGSLTIVTGLAVGTFAVSVEGNHASARDRDSKRALAAAEAGLQAAMLRITELQPEANECVGADAIVPLNNFNECPASGPISIGNGATYNYVVATPTSGTCATVPGFTPTPSEDRCITSIGTVNGIQRRLQLRFYFNPPFLPWGNAGLVGKNKVDIGNNKIIDSAIGTNGQVSLGNNSNAWELLLPTYDDQDPPELVPAPSLGNNATIDTAVAGGSAIRTPRVDTWRFPKMDWDTPRAAAASSSAALESGRASALGAEPSIPRMSAQAIICRS